MEEVTLKAGLYLAIDKISKDEFIVALAGKSPLLKIVNVLRIDEFVKGNIEPMNQEVINHITKHPDEYSFTELKTAVMPVIQDSKISYKKENFEEWVKVLEENDSIPEITALIMKDTGYSYEIAQSIATDVNIRVCERRGV